MTTATDTRTIGMVGNLTADPELHFSAKGTAYATSRISVRPYVAGAEVQPDAEFFDLVCFGGLAENVAEVLRKGSRVVVSGRLETDTWTGQDGVERESRRSSPTPLVRNFDSLRSRSTGLSGPNRRRPKRSGNLAVSFHQQRRAPTPRSRSEMSDLEELLAFECAPPR